MSFDEKTILYYISHFYFKYFNYFLMYTIFSFYIFFPMEQLDLI